MRRGRRWPSEFARSRSPPRTHRACGDTHRECPEVTFEERANEIAAPPEARRLAPREEGARESPSQPQAAEPRLAELVQREAAHVHERHATRERLRACLDEVRR